MTRRVFGAYGILILLSGVGGLLASTRMLPAQPAAGLEIDWEVPNRFRLFAEQKEFDRHVEAMRKAAGTSVLASEQWLEEKYGGRGWADTVGGLCFDVFRGRILETCKRDGHDETYLNPPSIRIKLQAKLPADFGEAVCDWTIGPVNIARTIAARNCREPVDDARASTKSPTPITVIARNQANATLEGKIAVQVRDILIVGIGDSIASGEGNPIHPVRLDDEGFCFRRALSGASKEFVLPGRAGLNIVKSCENGENSPETRDLWDSKGAGWLYNSCHRSLYSYQMRTALALAVENRRLSVTFLPLGCTGAEIGDGLLEAMEARERPKKDGVAAPKVVEAQMSQLRNYLRSITDRRGRRRPIDLLLLTIGANDIGFSGLVANVIVQADLERRLLKDTFVDVEDAAESLKELRDDFRLLRRQLHQVMGNTLDRVVFVTYGNPGKSNDGSPCAESRTGFDAHPAFTVNGDTLKKAVEFVDEKFIPTLKNYVTCLPDGGCARPDSDAMKYVDGHIAEFAKHGFCAQSDDDPEFDRRCFKDGTSFRYSSENLSSPLTCAGFRPRQFQPYAKRARWIRTANDSYFSAMTYPSNAGFFNSPLDLHDARWGLTSVVYGGAIHPTAEGHSAAADAALPAAREALGLPPPASP
jgi:hypothetical protein